MNEIQKAKDFYNSSRDRVYVINPAIVAKVIVIAAALITAIVWAV